MIGNDKILYYIEKILQERDLSIERVSTGIPKLDELLQGGLPKGSVILLSGPPGSGKSILCFHFIKAGVDNGEKCLYISADQNVKNIIIHANAVGFDFISAIEEGLLRLTHLDLEKSKAFFEIGELVLGEGYKRIVLDSLSPFVDVPVVLNQGIDFEKIPVVEKLSTYPIDSRPVARYHVRRIFDFLRGSSATSIVTSELTEGSSSLSRDSISEFLADGVILLQIDPMMDRRKIIIWKMRGTKHTLKPIDMVITERGVEIK